MVTSTPTDARERAEPTTIQLDELVDATARALTANVAGIAALKVLREQVVRPEFQTQLLATLSRIEGEWLQDGDTPALVSLENPLLASFQDAALAGRRELVASGAIVSSKDLSARLGITPQALTKACADKRLFYLEVGAERYYPAFYADISLDRQQLEKICKVLGDHSGPSKWQFFTRPKGSLGGETPLEMLRKGKFEEVARSAHGFAER